MTAMPIINDRMIVALRRSGKRQATYSRARGSRVVSNGSRAVPQQVNPCVGKHGEPCSVCPPNWYCCDGYPHYGPC
jgi:hypothetical protein